MILAEHPHDEHAERAERWRLIRERTTRGMLAYNAGAVVHLEGELFGVRSSSSGGFYRVDYSAERCECADYEHRSGPLGIACKHIAAVDVSRAARRSGVREIRTVKAAAGDGLRLAGSRRLCELREIVRHDFDESERERAHGELARLMRRELHAGE